MEKTSGVGVSLEVKAVPGGIDAEHGVIRVTLQKVAPVSTATVTSKSAKLSVLSRAASKAAQKKGTTTLPKVFRIPKATVRLDARLRAHRPKGPLEG